MNANIIVVDDEQDFLDSVKRGLMISGYRNVTLVKDPRNAVSILENGKIFDLALIDITMPFADGVSLLELIKRRSPSTECLMITALNDVKTAVECIKKGAYDYLLKPISHDALVSCIRRALERKRFMDVLDAGRAARLPALINKEAFGNIVTQSENMLRLLKEAELHAASDVPVLITGESGTGKELLAEAIHRCSDRSAFPFTAINMSTLTGGLFEAEFFGHTKGAFTGADRDRQGFIEHTHRGTLFLDEIGDLPHAFQGKLLRVLQSGEFMKIGSSETKKVDIRIIAATNRDLEKLIAREAFRGDLYWRLKGAWLQIPPLRERKSDIPVLTAACLKKIAKGKKAITIDEDTLEAIIDYDYPGNVRELMSIIQSAVNLSQGGPVAIRHLPGEILRKRRPALRSAAVSEEVVLLSEMERKYILSVYEQTGRNKSQCAKILGIGLNTLRRKLFSYRIP